MKTSEIRQTVQCEQQKIFFISNNINIHIQMNPNASNIQGNYRSTIEPYYMKGDVFQRDQRYYDQTISTRRNRTPNKSMGPSQINNSAVYGNTMNQGTGLNASTGGPMYQTSGPTGPTGYSQVNVLPPPASQDPEELKRLREQNLLLASQLQKLTYGGQFGTGDAVIKMGHYTASKAENATIRQQQAKIKNLQDTVRLNNEKLIKYQKASNQLQIRMKNIQSIDKEIYKQLRGASTRDKELLERASSALARGEAREGVMRILEQIVIS